MLSCIHSRHLIKVKLPKFKGSNKIIKKRILAEEFIKFLKNKSLDRKFIKSIQKNAVERIPEGIL